MKPTKVKGYIDPLLEDWLEIINQDDTDVGVVLQCDGIIVSGTLISYTAFMKIYFGLMEQSNPDIKESNDRLLAYENRARVHNTVTREVRIANLRDVTIVEGGVRYRSELWRVKAESVSGWFFGGLPEKD